MKEIFELQIRLQELEINPIKHLKALQHSQGTKKVSTFLMQNGALFKE